MTGAVWFLYLIECADGSLYTGITTDVARRYAEHLAGRGARYTRARKPVRLVATCPCGSRAEALKAEWALKRLPRQRKQAVIEAAAAAAAAGTAEVSC